MRNFFLYIEKMKDKTSDRPHKATHFRECTTMRILKQSKILSKALHKRAGDAWAQAKTETLFCFK